MSNLETEGYKYCFEKIEFDGITNLNQSIK